jgi:hypothetical protein
MGRIMTAILRDCAAGDKTGFCFYGPKWGAELCVLSKSRVMLRFFLASLVLVSSGLGQEAYLAAADRLEEKLLKSLSKEEAALAAGLPFAEDLTFLRRVTVDLCGRLPTAAEVDEVILAETERARLLAGKSESWSEMRARRAKWVQRLLAEPAADEQRYLRLADTLRVQDEHWAEWLREEVRADKPWDKLLSEMLLAMGESRTSGATGLLLRDEGDRLTTGVFLAGALLGRDLHCARCHDHPFSDEIQSGTYHWAACVPPATGLKAKDALAPARVLYKGLLSGGKPWGPQAMPAPLPLQPEQPLAPGGRPALTVPVEMRLPGLALPMRYFYRDHKPGELLEPRGLDMYDTMHRKVARKVLPTRLQWEQWLIKERRGDLARLMGMRLWVHLMGEAGRHAELMEGQEELPMKRMPGDCCAAPRRALNWLADDEKLPLATQLAVEFQRLGMSMRQMQAVICLTPAYHREARAETQPGRPLVAAQPTLRRLPAEVLWEVVTQWQAITAARKPDARRAELPEVPPAGHPLRLLGCSLREWPDEAYAPVTHALILWLANGEQTLHTLSTDSLLINQAAIQGGVRHLFISLLGRPPSAWEQDSATAPGVTLSDVAWALLQTSEFLFQH